MSSTAVQSMGTRKAPTNETGGEATRLLRGLAPRAVHRRLCRGRRMGDVGQRMLAFYLLDMHERRTYQDLGCSSISHYAETRLDLPRRRTRELLAAGRALESLPAIDEAFCKGRLSWSRVLLLLRVATVQHEQEWLERACELSCRELELLVRRSRPGSAPRAAGDSKGLPEIRFPLHISTDTLTHQQWELARAKLGAERDDLVTDVEVLRVLTGMFLQLEQDGSVPGYAPVSASLYRVVLRVVDLPETVAGAEALAVETDDGPVGIEGDDARSRACSAALRCDAEHVYVSDATPNGHGHQARHVQRDVKTPARLRRRVMSRDGMRCRSCSSRHGLHVHHVEYREHGGPTCESNLITLCLRCHGLVHAGLLVPIGRDARTLRWEAAGGAEAADVLRAEAEGIALAVEVREGGAPPSARPVALADVPERVDGNWWRRHAPALRTRRDGSIELRADVPLPADEGAPAQAADVRRPAAPESPESRALALTGLPGLSALTARLARVADASEARGTSFPHTLIVGPPGTGKTTLARRIARRLGAPLVAATGSVVQDVPALLGLLAGLESGAVLFLDEIHAIPRPVLESLYQAMTDRCVPLGLSQGVNLKATALELPPFTLVAATTEEAELPHALHGRFGVREQLGWYEIEALAEIALHAAAGQGVRLEPDAASALARAARGTPRETLRLLERVLDDVWSASESGSAGVVTQAHVQGALRWLGYDETGLDPDQQRYLSVLCGRRAAVPLGRLARWLGLPLRTVVEHVEPLLIQRGLVRVTPRGRMAVRQGE